MIRRQDWATLCLYVLGYSRLRNFILRLQRKRLTRIVTFHDVSARDLPHFSKNLRFLKRHMNVVTLDEFLSGRLSSKKINVVITFDDGYKGWFTHAIPVLKREGLPAAFFVSSGLIGLSPEDEARFFRVNLGIAPPVSRDLAGLSAEDLRQMAASGFTLGGHTLHHLRLDRLGDAAAVKREIADDKIALEKIVGREIKYFAYPSGGFDNASLDIVDLLKGAGYAGAVTTLPGFNSIATNRFQLRRELTSASMAPVIFRARVYGNFDAVLWLKNRARRKRPA
jgi:peptidoglycan/xylan/chitin deacetylase (PgdA/CDA1 family)